MHKILIIEDEPAILLALKDELAREYCVLGAAAGLKGAELVFQENPDLILLDIVLPDTDGFTLCRHFKEKGSDASIIMVTARDQVVDKVRGLESGADDYITKPFSLDELKARIKAVLRRKELAPIEAYKDDILEIDFKKYKALKNQKNLKFSYLEFKLLRFFISQRGRIISRKELLEQVWGYHILPSTRTVDVHILSLRKKVGKRYIATIPRLGYRFDSPYLPTS